jgi:hypothetical protein
MMPETVQDVGMPAEHLRKLRGLYQSMKPAAYSVVTSTTQGPCGNVNLTNTLYEADELHPASQNAG